MLTHHQQKTICSPDGRRISIVPLIRQLWRLGIRTVQSCEDVQGYVSVGVFGARDAARYILAAQGEGFAKEDKWCRRLTDIGAMIKQDHERQMADFSNGLEPIVQLSFQTRMCWKIQVDPFWPQIYCQIPLRQMPEVMANLGIATLSNGEAPAEQLSFSASDPNAQDDW